MAPTMQLLMRFFVLCLFEASLSWSLGLAPQESPAKCLTTAKTIQNCPACSVDGPTKWTHRVDSQSSRSRLYSKDSSRSLFGSSSYRPSRLQWLQQVVATTFSIAACDHHVVRAADADDYLMPRRVTQPLSVDDDYNCNTGCLAVERAIPGAYESSCMTKATRRIPIHISGSSPSSDVMELVLEQDELSVGPGSTGLVVWNSSILLQRLLEQLVLMSPSFLYNKVVLELGCGVGLGSLTSAVLGASRVIATDGNDQVLQLAQRNVQRNQMQATVVVEPLRWGLMEAIDWADTADVVIGADLTYNPGSWRSLAETMASVVSTSGYVVYLSLGHPGFNVNGELDGFLAVAREQGLISLSPHDVEWPFPNISISLSELVRQACLKFPREQSILDGTGGVRVLLLKRKQRPVKSY